LDPATLPTILVFGMPQLAERLGPDHTAVGELQKLLLHFQKLPRGSVRAKMRGSLPILDIEQWLAQLAQIVASSPAIEHWAQETAEHFGLGVEGQQRLRKLLDAQNYRLVFWRRAAT